MGLKASTLKHLEITSDESVWLDFLGEYAFLGRSLSEALVTAQKGDWWVESRDGELSSDHLKKYQSRTHENESEENSLDYLYHKNLECALRFSTKQRSSEPKRIIIESCLPSEQEPLIEGTLFFYKLSTPSFFRFWGGRKLPGLYTFDSYTCKWRPVKIVIKPDGYMVKYGKPFKQKGKSLLCGELNYEMGSQVLLNFKFWNNDGMILKFANNKWNEPEFQDLCLG